MSNRGLSSSTTLSMNYNPNRKWEGSITEQGSSFANLSSPTQKPRYHVQENEKGMFRISAFFWVLGIIFLHIVASVVSRETMPFTSSALFRTIIFVVLTLQATCYFSLLRYSRTRPNKMYFSSTAVFLAEVVKLLVTLAVIFFQRGNLKEFVSFLVDNLLTDPMAAIKLSVPSVLYVIQNNLVYIAMTHLESTTFQITNQLKILTAAIFSIALLNKQLTRIKWVSLILLSVGVTMVQIDSHTAVTSDLLTNSNNPVKKEQSMPLGLASVLAASLVSGFAGVYMEKIFKKQRRTSFWISNAQLYTFGMFLGLIGVIYQDGVEISQMGFFHGYDFVVCLVVLFASAGGIIVSLILKYASCITKGFATSCAIVLSSIVSVYVFDFVPSVLFVVGALSVIVAVLLYS